MFGDYVNFINTMLDYTTEKGNTIGNNIANINTPNYKAKKTEFENIINRELKTEMNVTREKHISSKNSITDLTFDTKPYSNNHTRVDGNNVDQTKEMIELVKNNYIHNLNIAALNKEFSLIKTAIRNN